MCLMHTNQETRSLGEGEKISEVDKEKHSEKKNMCPGYRNT